MQRESCEDRKVNCEDTTQDGMATKRNVSTRQGRSSSRTMTEFHDPMHIFKGSIVTVTSIAVISNPPALTNL